MADSEPLLKAGLSDLDGLELLVRGFPEPKIQTGGDYGS
jgi:hypothetical protein